MLTIVLSAMSFAAAFVSPQFFWWTVFIFLLPIFLQAFGQQQLTFRHGFVWGLIFYSIHMLGILMLLHTKAEGAGRIIGYLVLVIYFALYAGVWFWSANRLSKIISATMSWLLVTFLYFTFMSHAAFWPLESWFGYPMSYPLLPLMEHPKLLWLLPIMGSNLLLFFLIVSSLCTAKLIMGNLKTGSRFIMTGLIISLLPFGSGIFYRPVKSNPEFLKYIGYLSAPEHADDPWEACQEIIESIRTLREQYPEITTIIMPESSIKRALNEYLRIIHAISDNALYDNAHLIMGSHRNDGEHLYNCLYLLRSRLIIQHYDKRCLLPIGEYMPSSWKNLFIMKKLFINNRKKEFCRSPQNDSVSFITINFSLNLNMQLSPLICSELYFRNRQLPGASPIICISNDGWFSDTPYFQQLLTQLAHYRSLEWGRPILYVSHSGAWWFENIFKFVLKK